MGAKKTSKAWIGLVISGVVVLGAIGNSLPIDNAVGNSIQNQSNNLNYSNTYVSNLENILDSENKYNELMGVNEKTSISLSEIPAYSGNPYVKINNNNPFFNSYDLTTSSYEKYSSLDYLGRCGVAISCIGTDLMPTEERGEIGSVKPTGWHTVRYNGIDGNYLYNRCHLIGYQLSGENANEKNLITGTRYLNTQGMLPFENKVAEYVKRTNHHVLYRVTPMFDGSNLLASGVLIEAQSIEDDEIKFNVYCYNVQPGIEINYANGDSTGPEFTGANNTSQTNIKTETETKQETNKEAVAPVVVTQKQTPKTTQTTTTTTSNDVSATYILNMNTKKFHKPSCASAKKIKDSNKDTYSGSRQDLINRGYVPCKNCNP